ncbi:ABC transporter ATP-binding protein [Actinomadura barringtoniae]|uniref:ABC transporter ATP-binding protein n=1 Tax=Actinomadura barringtoniae TaxID=1427535 RepID=A0A939PJ64_9ACTN|nr:ABC transporter ATP-binding protein [Actinomadura barringtoniae]MBO2450794.1 ABC transporter ATP-binding protein [Actinomadura barringtoniae]
MMRPAAAALELAWASGRTRLLIRVALTIVGSAVPVAMAWLMKAVLDGLTAPDRPSLVLPALLLAAAGMAAAFLPQAVQYVESELQRAVDLTARKRLYAAVARMPGLRRFEDPRFQDRLALAAETGPTGPSEVVSGGLGGAQGLLMLGGFFVTLAVLNPWMLVPVVLAGAVSMHGQIRLSHYRARVLGELGHATRREQFYAQLLTSPSAAKEVRLYGLSDLFGTRMLRELRWINRRRRTMDRRELIVQGLHGLAGACVAGGGLVWAVDAARSGRLTVGDVSMFIAAVSGVQNGLAVVAGSAGRMHEAMLTFGHYLHVVGAEPDLPESSRASGLEPLREGIELRDVWFRYGDGLPWVLRGVTLTIPVGRATALVGPNGAGKSTLVKLLCRFYDPTRGTILWDGVDLRDIPVADLRARIGTVFQDYMSYELSAADNIGVGRREAMDDRDRVEAAARRAGCHGTLAELPRGYDTMLSRAFDSGEHDDPDTGVLLSGGQWQRVAIARALLRDDADLLILDEPSSGLDAEAEHEVHTRLREHRAGRTSLLISHRLSTVREADSIVVLSGGAVAERGTHDGLLAAGGVYARLFTLQASGYQQVSLTASSSDWKAVPAPRSADPAAASD